MSVLVVKYDVVIEITNIEEEYTDENMAGHKPICYYIRKGGYVEEQNSIFKKLDIGMLSHLKLYL